MPSYIDTKYVNILSSRLPLFKRKTNGLYNFRCPFCGDSQKSRTKARGYFYQKRTDLFFRCHNCGQSSTFSNFLKQFDGETYKEYALERYKEGITGKGHNTPDPKVEYKQPKFHKMTNREYDLSKNEQRLVNPFFDKDKQLITFQGRAFINTQLRYITIKMDEESSKIFGLERLDIKKKFYIVEGPFDSMFLPNCLAMAGSDVSFRGNDDIKEAMDNHKGTIIFDNEPRNKEIITRMEKVIDKGWNICIWPDSVACKDINDMIMTSINETKILEIINKNTFKNLHAKTHLAQWRKK